MAVKYEPVKITIVFWANPKEQTLDLEELGEGNFQWVAYGLLFKVSGEDKYYAYGSKLNPDGNPQDGTESVYASDSAGKLYKDEDIDIIPDDVHKFFPRLFQEKKPDLTPHGDFTAVYTNIHMEGETAPNPRGKAKGKEYSSQEFNREFNKDYYAVITKEKEVVNPFGKELGRKKSASFYDEILVEATDHFGSCPKCGSDKSKIVWGWHGSYYDMVCANGHQWTYDYDKVRRAVKTAMEIYSYYSGGFDIMKKFQKKLKKKQKSEKK